jgi:DcmR-like sensory protein
VITTAQHRARFLQSLEPKEGQLKLLDAEKTLERFMASGVPEWKGFEQIVGGAIAELRLRYPAVRVYGEMVDVLWQGDQRDAALRLEQYWNELRSVQTFSLLCAYRFDNLDSNGYGGPLESVCKAHTHLIPVRDYARLDQAVSDAARKILDAPLAQILLSLSANHRPVTHMPPGQATLLWLRQNMPRTAERILDAMRSSAASAD